MMAAEGDSVRSTSIELQKTINGYVARFAQVFKDGLRCTIMGTDGKKRKKNVRYFSRAELKQLFTLYPPGQCQVRDTYKIVTCTVYAVHHSSRTCVHRIFMHHRF